MIHGRFPLVIYCQPPSLPFSRPCTLSASDFCPPCSLLKTTSFPIYSASLTSPFITPVIQIASIPGSLPEFYQSAIGKALMLGKIEGKTRRRQQRTRWLESIPNSMDMNLSKLQETVTDRGTWHAAVRGVAKNQTRIRKWATVSSPPFCISNNSPAI